MYPTEAARRTQTGSDSHRRLGSEEREDVMIWQPHRSLRLALALALPGLTAARAQDFPSKPITIMVGLAAGGITDVTARLYAEAVSKSIGQRIIIENRQGAGGAVAAAAVQNATPDGYTLLVFSGSQHAAVPAVQSAPYDPVKGFQPVTLLFNLAALVAVPATSPANTVGGIARLWKEEAGRAPVRLARRRHALASARRQDQRCRPRRRCSTCTIAAAAPMMADLVTGRVDFALASYTVVARASSWRRS